MGKLPDGTDPYGRLIDLMKKASPDVRGIVLGEYLGNKKFQVGDMTLDPGDYIIIQTQITIDGKTFNLPGLETQTKTITRTVTNSAGSDTFTINVSVPALQKGDAVIAYQFGDEEYVIIGKVV